MEGTMGHLLWSRYPLVPLVSRFTIMGDLPSIIQKKKNSSMQMPSCDGMPSVDYKGGQSERGFLS